MSRTTEAAAQYGPKAPGTLKTEYASKQWRAKSEQPFTEEEILALRKGNSTLATPGSRRILLSRLFDMVLTRRVDWHRANTCKELVLAAGVCRDFERDRKVMDELLKFRDEVGKLRAAARVQGTRVNLAEQMEAAALAVAPVAGSA